MSRFDARRIVAASRRFISEIQSFDRQYDDPGYDQYRHRVQVLIMMAGRDLNLALEGRTLFGSAAVPEVSVCDYRSEIQCYVIRECLRRLLRRAGLVVKDDPEKDDPEKDDSAAKKCGLPPMSNLEQLPLDGLPELMGMQRATDELGRLIKEVQTVLIPSNEADLPGKTADSSCSESITPEQVNAEKLYSALRDLGGISRKIPKTKGILRYETGLTDREYRAAIELLKKDGRVRTKTIGAWLVS